MPIGKNTKSSEGKSPKIPVTAYLLDNLWLWAILIFIIAMAYGVWAMIDSGAIHMPPGITPK